MQRGFNGLVGVALVIALLMGSCSESPQKKAARIAADKAAEALTALRKVQASTEVGSTRLQYEPLVIEAKAKVNEASSALPEGQLKIELIAAIDAYADALQTWQAARNNSVLAIRYWSQADDMIKKYNLMTKSADGEDYVVLQDTLNKIWAAATGHVDRAASLLRQ